MRQSDTTLANWQDIPAAIGLLTRIPVPVDMEFATARGSKAAWAWPLAGLAVALPAAALGWLFSGFGAGIAAGIALVTLIVLTGALHEDGLADCADGFWGGYTKERRLEIMKDSRVGSYGVIALVLGLGLKWQALTVIDTWAALIAAALLSRAAMAGVMAALPFARENGLAAAQGRPSRETALLSAGLAFVAALFLCGSSALLALLAVAAVAVLTARIAQAKLGGQTGDVLGATQFLAELAALIALGA